MEEESNTGKDHSIITAAIIFLLIGVTFGVIIVKQIFLGDFALSFFLLVLGMFFFASALEMESGIGEWIASLGWTLNMLGGILFYQYKTGNWESWAYVWPLIFPAGIGLGQLLYGVVKARRDPIERGKTLVQIGLGLFVLGLILFTLFF
ncbi:MAG: hypothetical protein ACPK85_10235 [Methanosarcina sp.]